MELGLRGLPTVNLRPFPRISRLFISHFGKRGLYYDCQTPKNMRELNMEAPNPIFCSWSKTCNYFGNVFALPESLFSFSVGGHLGLSDLVSVQLVQHTKGRTISPTAATAKIQNQTILSHKSVWRWNNLSPIIFFVMSLQERTGAFELCRLKNTFIDSLI